jgi:hypothetical protein
MARAGLKQPPCLASGYSAATDYNDSSAGQIEHDGISVGHESVDSTGWVRGIPFWRSVKHIDK